MITNLVKSKAVSKKGSDSEKQYSAFKKAQKLNEGNRKQYSSCEKKGQLMSVVGIIILNLLTLCV